MREAPCCPECKAETSFDSQKSIYDVQSEDYCIYILYICMGCDLYLGVFEEIA